MRSSSRIRWPAIVTMSMLVGLAGPIRPALAELTFEVVKSFALPESSPSALVVGTDGALYGTTPSGGSLGLGMVFRVDGAGHFTELHAFSRSDGAFPWVTLVVGA